MQKNLLLFFSLSIILFFSCKPSYSEKGDPEYISGINKWAEKRAENLKKENGWLNLAGLFWLNEGENTFGTDESNDIIFPLGEKHMGKFFRNGDNVNVEIAKDVEVLIDSQVVKSMTIGKDADSITNIFDYGSLRWFVIKRSDKIGIRLRNLNSDLVKNFTGIDRYPVNEDWKIKAEYVKYDIPKKILIPNIIGQTDQDVSPGEIRFKIDGKEYTLNPLDTGKRFWLIFADITNGEETYGAGRFLYTDKPDENGIVYIDFNKAYNPPCAFTAYATCPLPPKENQLTVAVTAGEKNFGHH
ncbi:MAG: DUF1684 domain-containing protein [Ignavibacteria bacterium]|jgi:uncharacterized protein (DUF1684 family)